MWASSGKEWDGKEQGGRGRGRRCPGTKQDLGLGCPSQALPVLLRDRDGIIAAETGSGKTLAYLIPIVERVFREDPTTIADPIAAVVVPTQELVQQVHRVVKTVFPLLDPFVRVAYANVGPPRRDRFAVVIATPKALRENVRDARLAHLRLLVLDEADLLLDGDYARDTKQWLLTQQRSRSARAQMIFAAATVPDRGARSVRGFLDRFFKCVQRRTKPEERKREERSG